MKKNRLIRFPGLLKRFRKNLMFIKCCIVFIFVFSLNLSAHVFSQSKLVTLDLKEVSVEKFVDAVKQQTGMKMMYNSGVVREAGQVSVQVKDKELSEVLDMVLKKVNLEYELYNDIILIRAKGEVPAGPKVLKGVVKDKSGAVLPGVTVVIKGTTLGVSTDIDGKYSITIPEDGKETVLMFTFVGMKPQEVRYAGQETLNVILTEEVAEMEEVVVKGYFTRKKESFTGVSKTFSGDELKTISTGNILREAIKNQTALGLEAKSYMDGGKLVPDEIVINILRDRISRDDCKNGFILDGFPRTVPQARALDEMKVAIDRVIDIEVPDEKIMARLSGRRVCESCGASYHVDYKPSKEPGVCDACGGKTVQRKDDHPDTIKERLRVYHEQTEPLKDYYYATGKLFVVEGQEEVADTTALTLKAVNAEA